MLAAAVPACWAVAGDWRDDEAFSRALLRADPGHVRALTRLGRHLVVEARRDREAAEALPVTPANRPLIAAHLASSAARTAEAVRLLERARSLPDGRRSALVSWRLGDAYMALREPRFEAAEEAYRRVLETKRVRVGPRRVPWNRVTDKTRVAAADRRDLAMLFWNRALAAEGIGEGERAAGFTETAAEWYPEDARDPERYRYVRQAGVVVWRQLDDPGRALPWLVEAARIAPPSERAVASADADAARDAVRDRSKNALRPRRSWRTSRARSGTARRSPCSARPWRSAPTSSPRTSGWRGSTAAGATSVPRWAALSDARVVLDREKAQTGADADPKARAAVDELEATYIRERDEVPETSGSPADTGRRGRRDAGRARTSRRSSSRGRTAELPRRLLLVVGDGDLVARQLGADALEPGGVGEALVAAERVVPARPSPRPRRHRPGGRRR